MKRVPCPTRALWLLAVWALALAGCAPQMEIEGIEPDGCNPGDIVVLQGYGFGDEQGASTVAIPSGHPVEVLDWSDSEIRVVVPEETPAGHHRVVLTVFAGDLPHLDTAYLAVEADPILYRVLAFGDSITRGVGTAYGGYTYYLEDLLDTQKGSTAVINAGVGGELTAEGLARFASTLTRWNDVGFVLLLEGTNDVTDTSGAGPLEDIVGRLSEMIRIARDDYLLQVVLGTLPPRRTDQGDQESPTTEELVQALRELALEENVPLADHYQAFIETPGWQDLFSDNLHPNDAGYLLLADSWYDGALAALLP